MEPSTSLSLTARLVADRLIIPSIVPSGEWHRTAENVRCLETLVNKVFSPEQVLIGHHINFTKDGKGYEIASVETFLFDPNVLSCLFGSRAQLIAEALARCEPTQRLSLTMMALSQAEACCNG